MQKIWLVIGGKATAYPQPYFSYSNTLPNIKKNVNQKAPYRKMETL